MFEQQVVEAMEALSDADQARFMRDVDAFMVKLGNNLSATTDIEFDIRHEAAMRRILEDPTWTCWRAWLDSRALAAEVQALSGPEG